MALTLRTSNGLSLTAEANEWITGLVLMLEDSQKARLVEVVLGLTRTSSPLYPQGIEHTSLPDGTRLTLINGATRL
jgi:hypothetical protein